MVAVVKVDSVSPQAQKSARFGQRKRLRILKWHEDKFFSTENRMQSKQRGRRVWSNWRPFVISVEIKHKYHTETEEGKGTVSGDTFWKVGTRGVVGWGAMLQDRRSRVDFRWGHWISSIYLILPAPLWSWGRLSLYYLFIYYYLRARHKVLNSF
jgi:hypothetical protein